MKNILRGAEFISSAVSASGFVADNGCEVCFIGRSNAGKSSAINTLCDNQKLVKTSKTPGRTQAINFFAVSEHQRLVDLPGYGFAGISDKQRARWDQLLADYFTQRRSLQCVCLVVDIRRGLVAKDKEAITWLHSLRPDLPVHVLLSKSDKVNRSESDKALRESSAWLEQCGVPCSVQIFSAVKGDGVAQARAVLINHLQTSAPPN